MTLKSIDCFKASLEPLAIKDPTSMRKILMGFGFLAVGAVFWIKVMMLNIIPVESFQHVSSGFNDLSSISSLHLSDIVTKFASKIITTAKTEASVED